MVGEVLVDGLAESVQRLAGGFEPLVNQVCLHVQCGDSHVLGAGERPEAEQFVGLAGMIAGVVH
jgi:hypothetical protein